MSKSKVAKATLLAGFVAMAQANRDDHVQESNEISHADQLEDVLSKADETHEKLQ